MVDYTGQRIYARLNVPEPDVGERHRFVWLNSDWRGQGSATPLNILQESDPPAVRLTGRTRMEKRHGKADEEGECVEMEVLAAEEGLLRQCYYCLDWEQDNVARFLNCGTDDVFWCPSVSNL